MTGQPYESKHAGENTGRPDYTYTGRHEAAARAFCPATADVHSMDGERGGVLVCSWNVHDGAGHWDESERIFWRTAPVPAAEITRPEPAGAVA